MSQHLFDAFGNNETEVSAGYIVRFCQRQDGWTPFTEEEIEAFYNEAGHQGFWFNCLTVENEWIVRGDDRRYRVTHDFIARCFRSRPAVAVLASAS